MVPATWASGFMLKKARKVLEKLDGMNCLELELTAIKLKIPLNGRILPAVRLSDHAPFWD